MAEPGAVPDDVPYRHPVLQPFAVQVASTGTDAVDGGRRIAFEVTVRDAVGQPCPDLAVEARITGPARTATGMAHTDPRGRAVFRMTGPAGHYRCEVLDVGAGAVRLQQQGEVLASADADVAA